MVDLAVIGHVGFNEEITQHGDVRSPGGAGYAVARGTTVVPGERVGLVAMVGADYDPAVLHGLGVNMSGVGISAGRSAYFRTTQHIDGGRSVEVDLGVAATPPLSCFPVEYRSARHVHICTAPPSQQLRWIEFLRALPGRRTISCDAFEHYAEIDPKLSRAALAAGDLMFLNDQERRLIFADDRLPKPAIIKHGSGGATYSGHGAEWFVPASRVGPVDTTHAGEILAGVYLALVAGEISTEVALEYAVRSATAKVTEFGVDGNRLRQVLSSIRGQISATPYGEAVPQLC